MTKSKAKTIEIFLPDGVLKTIEMASITSRTVEVTYMLALSIGKKLKDCMTK